MSKIFKIKKLLSGERFSLTFWRRFEAKPLPDDSVCLSRFQTSFNWDGKLRYRETPIRDASGLRFGSTRQIAGSLADYLESQSGLPCEAFWINEWRGTRIISRLLFIPDLQIRKRICKNSNLKPENIPSEMVAVEREMTHIRRELYAQSNYAPFTQEDLNARIAELQAVRS